MKVPMRLQVDVHSPIPIRWQLTEQLKHVIEGGGVPRERALPSIRALAGFLGINPNTVARAIEDLKRSGHVEARRGKGVFVASALPVRIFPTRREDFLKDAVIRGAALAMTPDDVAVGVLSVAGVGLAALRNAVAVLLVECSLPELDFFGRELEAQLPVRVDKVLLSKLAGTVTRRKRADRWGAAVTSFGHLPEVARRMEGLGVPVVALLAEVNLETLHRLAQLPEGTRVGVVSVEHRVGTQSGALDRHRGPAEHRTGRGQPGRGAGTESAGEAGGRHRLLDLGRGTGAAPRGADDARDRRRSRAQPAGPPKARGHPGPARRRPPARLHVARRPLGAWAVQGCPPSGGSPRRWR